MDILNLLSEPIGIIAAVICLGVLIFVHELGHFLAAKRVGIRVEKFSLGFGPRVWGFERGDTEYRLSWLPFGGYVKLSGQDPEEELEGVPEHQRFYAKSIWERLQVIVAGPVMNLLLPFAVLPLVFMIGYPMPEYLAGEPVVGLVLEGSPAAQVGIQVGDRVTSVGSLSIDNWEDLLTAMAAHREEQVQLAVKRGEQSLSFNVRPSQEPGMGIGITHRMKAQVGRLLDGYPAASSGLQVGDIIVAIGGKPVEHWDGMRRIIQAHPGERLKFDVLRDESPVELFIEPLPNPDNSKLGMIGISPLQRMVEQQYGPIRAVTEGALLTVKLTYKILYFFKNLIVGNLPMRATGGPVAITQAIAGAVKMGLADLLFLVAFISLNLGIFNLVVPVPVLDAGQIAFLAFEKVMGRPVSVERQRLAFGVGWVLLIAVMVMVTYNDIRRIWPDMQP